MKAIDLATDIYDELGETGLSIPFISSWLRNNIGKLNLELDLNIVPSGQFLELEPELETDQAGIYKLLFLEHYYGRQARANLGANGYQIIRATEGDSTIQFAEKKDVEKSYIALQKDTRSAINDAVKMYRLNYSVPKQATTSGDWSVYPLNVPYSY
jgi:hypothetical protein